jgi:hypothetical protein
MTLDTIVSFKSSWRFYFLIVLGLIAVGMGLRGDWVGRNIMLDLKGNHDSMHRIEEKQERNHGTVLQVIKNQDEIMKLIRERN